MKKNNGIKGLIIIFTLFIFFIPGILTASDNRRVAVTFDIVNVRSGPGIKEKILWQVEEYYPFVIVKVEDKWYKVKDFENDIGWIHSSMVKEIECVITVKDKCNVRSKPDINSEIVFTVDRGVPFRQVQKKGDWLRIQHADGNAGWIHKSLIW